MDNGLFEPDWATAYLYLSFFFRFSRLIDTLCMPRVGEAAAPLQINGAEARNECGVLVRLLVDLLVLQAKACDDLPRAGME